MDWKLAPGRGAMGLVRSRMIPNSSLRQHDTRNGMTPEPLDVNGAVPPPGAGPEIIDPVAAPPPSTRPRRAAAALARFLNPAFEGIERFRGVGAREAALRRFASCGEHLDFDPLKSVLSYEQISVGSNVYIGWGAYFFGEIEIGDDVMFGPEVHVQAGYHRFDIPGKLIRESGGDERRKVVIGSDVWVAARAAIMKGVTVGEGSVIGSGAMVFKDVPPYTIVIGAPARPFKRRFDDDELREHLVRRGRPDELVEEAIAQRARALEPFGI
jgi:maltose O-acetyltransferase